MVDTQQIMDVALDLAEMAEIPTDSGIWVPGRGIRKVLFGIDIGAAELAIAQRLGFDLAIGHHPPEATLEAWRNYLIHVEQMVAAGVPRDVAEESVAGEIEMMQWRAHGRNDEHTVSVARLLQMPYMNVHLPLDEVGRRLVQERIDALLRERPAATVGDVVETLYEFGEVRNARVPPRIAVGDAGDAAGKVVFSHGALDIPTYSVLSAYFAHGVGTVISLRAPIADLERLRREESGALIVIGHMAGDSVGITPFLGALGEMGLEVTRISGVIEAGETVHREGAKSAK